MAENNLPAHNHTRTVAGTSSRLPARGASDAPIHQAGQLRFGGSNSTREELWDRLNPAVREKVDQRVGQRLQWWAAEEDDGRVRVAALGTRALVVVTPVFNSSGGPATEITAISLNESSFRSVRVSVGAEAKALAGPGPGTALATTTQHTPSAALAKQLDEGISGFLGQLPIRAQQLLQDPFLSAARELRYDHFFYRVGNVNSLSGATLSVWCYFTDLSTVTFCAGHGQGYHESGGPRSWDLTCWRAEAAPRQGVRAGSGRR